MEQISRTQDAGIRTLSDAELDAVNGGDIIGTVVSVISAIISTVTSSETYCTKKACVTY